MLDLTDVEAVRPGLYKLCLLPTGRTNPPLADIERHRWHPGTVLHGATLSAYTDAGAWEFIAECLKSNCRLVCQPPTAEHDDHAYVLVESDGGPRRIYMKVAIRRGCDRLIGVSFHYERA